MRRETAAQAAPAVSTRSRNALASYPTSVRRGLFFASSSTTTMKHIVFITACVLLFLAATTAEVADDSGLRGSAGGLGAGGMGGGALASGGLENLLLNYLMAKQMARQMQREQVDQPPAVPDFQRKRSGWKQCSFNAVSCFGRRK
ncbi:uncharacterized protein LOC142576592 isoform X4 [Dermacentor variabilis]|uniref:uncharacterized protein LOC142576592 isoform X4 n=1 Tax=Dermacentor variabilis TaxID=34621 RepID=UPI003F5C087F